MFLACPSTFLRYLNINEARNTNSQAHGSILSLAPLSTLVTGCFLFKKTWIKAKNASLAQNEHLIDCIS